MSAQNPWAGRSVVSVDDFSVEDASYVLSLADKLRSKLSKRGSEDFKSVTQSCQGLVMACAFYEASTRTSCSFTAAMERLGGSVLSINASTSSVKKGETLSDTARCLACYSDILVLRHPEKGSARVASDSIRNMKLDDVKKPVPLLNAGDGAGEHPTQALLDIYTILREQGRTITSSEPLSVTLCGDLKYGRTTHSLAKLLCLYQGPLTINYVAPESLQMPEEIKTVVSSRRAEVVQNVFHTLEEAMKETDVLYMTRVQKERFPDEASYDAVKDVFVLTADSIAPGKCKSTMSILHPLPRVGEIAVEVDNDPRAAYFKQMHNGMYMRMALVLACLDISV